MYINFWYPIARGEDVWVWDDQGNRYLDATASLWDSNVGHGRASIERRIVSGEGPIKMMPFSAQASANSGLSERRPYPG